MSVSESHINGAGLKDLAESIIEQGELKPDDRRIEFKPSGITAEARANLRLSSFAREESPGTLKNSGYDFSPEDNSVELSVAHTQQDSESTSVASGMVQSTASMESDITTGIAFSVPLWGLTKAGGKIWNSLADNGPCRPMVKADDAFEHITIDGSTTVAPGAKVLVREGTAIATGEGIEANEVVVTGAHAMALLSGESIGSIHDGAKLKAGNRAQSSLHESSHGEFHDTSAGILRDRATAFAYDNSVIIAQDNARVQVPKGSGKPQVLLTDAATADVYGKALITGRGGRVTITIHSGATGVGVILDHCSILVEGEAHVIGSGEVAVQANGRVLVEAAEGLTINVTAESGNTKNIMIGSDHKGLIEIFDSDANPIATVDNTGMVTAHNDAAAIDLKIVKKEVFLGSADCPIVLADENFRRINDMDICLLAPGERAIVENSVVVARGERDKANRVVATGRKAEVRISGDSTAAIHDGASVKASDKARASLHETSTGTFRDFTLAVLHGSSQATVIDRTIVVANNHARVVVEKSSGKPFVQLKDTAYADIYSRCRVRMLSAEASAHVHPKATNLDIQMTNGGKVKVDTNASARVFGTGEVCLAKGGKVILEGSQGKLLRVLSESGTLKGIKVGKNHQGPIEIVDKYGKQIGVLDQDGLQRPAQTTACPNSTK